MALKPTGTFMKYCYLVLKSVVKVKTIDEQDLRDLIEYELIKQISASLND